MSGLRQIERERDIFLNESYAGAAAAAMPPIVPLLTLSLEEFLDLKIDKKMFGELPNKLRKRNKSYTEAAAAFLQPLGSSQPYMGAAAAAGAATAGGDYFQTLPRDIQNQILLHYPKEDYLKILEICEKYQICPESSRLWKLLWKRDCGSILPGMNLDTLKERYILSLRIYMLYKKSIDTPNDTLHFREKIMKIFYYLGADKFIEDKLLHNPTDLKGTIEMFLDEYDLDYEMVEFLLRCGAKFGDQFLEKTKYDNNLKRLSIEYYDNYDPKYGYDSDNPYGKYIRPFARASRPDPLTSVSARIYTGSIGSFGTN